jgi:hypothetical protein
MRLLRGTSRKTPIYQSTTLRGGADLRGRVSAVVSRCYVAALGEALAKYGRPVGTDQGSQISDMSAFQAEFRNYSSQVRSLDGPHTPGRPFLTEACGLVRRG